LAIGFQLIATISLIAFLLILAFYIGMQEADYAPYVPKSRNSKNFRFFSMIT